MTDQSILNSCYGVDWADYVHETHWPLIHPPNDQPAPGFFVPPKLFFSPIAGSLPTWHPNNRRRELDRVTTRLLKSGYPGSDIGVEYLLDKYTKNLSVSTISTSGRICLAFLQALHLRNTNIYQVTRKDISAFIAHEHNRGLKINSVQRALASIVYLYPLYG